MKGFDVDDDFGDLYADVEAQANSAINGVTNLGPFRNDGIFDCTERNESPSSDGEQERKDKVDEAVSDSEDDLNIVLNDKDCKSKSFGVLSDEYYMDNDDNDGFVAINDVKTRELSSPRDLKANLSVSKHQTVHGQCKGPVSGQSSLVGPTRNFGMSQRRFGFTLPWNRSILDVNIDTFEEKPWRYPGMDITDFFNFGFDEDTWKQYCNSVDQYRFSGSMALGNTDHVYGSQYDYEYGSKYGEQLEETVVDEARQPKGRAIQVEDGDSERQPTVDIRRQRDRDSDVVIQINLEDDSSDISEKPDHRGRGVTCEDSDNGDLGNEFSLGSMKENDARVSRSSEKTASSSNPMTDNDLDKVGDENRHKSSFSSDETHELIEPIKKSVKKSNNVSNVCSVSDVDTESPFEEEVGQLSLTPSLFESDSEDSRDSTDLDSRTITSPLSRSSEVLKGKNSKINPVDSRDFSKCKSPVRDNPRQWVSSVRWKEKYRNIGHSEEFDYSQSCVGRESTQNRLDRERDSHRMKNWKLRRHVREDESFSRHSYTREEMDSRSNRNNNNHKLQFRKSINRGTWFLDRNRLDSDFSRERFGRVTCDRSYERSRFEGSGRKRYENLYSLEAEYSVNHQLHRDSDRFKDEYSENMDIRYLSSHYYREYEEDSRFFDRDTTRRLSSCISHDDSFDFSDSFRFKRKRGCFRRSEVLPWTKKDITFRPQSENFDFFENRRHRRDYSTFESLEMESDQLGYKFIRDESKNRGSVYKSGKNCRGKKGQAFIRSRDSGDLGAKKEKDSIRCCRDRISRLDEDEDSKIPRFMGQSKNEDLDIEDGQIISNCDNNRRILESMAKMEKRRERFKEPITSLFKKEEQVKCSNSEIVVPFTVQHRPARRRQWRVR